MKKLIVSAFTLALLGSTGIAAVCTAPGPAFSHAVSGSIEIKIKNDTDDEVRVYNAGSGGSYTLTKGATTTLKMDEGDKLYYYEGGKKGDLILTASADMNGKVQLLSKL
ncbi:MAG: hypothetical protein ACT6QS_00450 [Flavobacteriales bacterium]